MAKATTIVKVTTTLELNEEESLYLRAILQNHLGDYAETPKNRDLRSHIFSVLNNTE